MDHNMYHLFIHLLFYESAVNHTATQQCVVVVVVFRNIIVT